MSYIVRYENKTTEVYNVVYLPIYYYIIISFKYLPKKYIYSVIPTHILFHVHVQKKRIDAVCLPKQKKKPLAM